MTTATISEPKSTNTLVRIDEAWHAEADAALADWAYLEPNEPLSSGENEFSFDGFTKEQYDAEMADRELCRRHLYPFIRRMQNIKEPFVEGWHVDLMCDAVEAMEKAVLNLDGGSTALRNIIQMPPRHCKSFTISQCAALWLISRNPTKECIVSGYGQEFISEFGDWMKEAVDHPAYTAVFPDMEWRRDSKAKNRILTKRFGGIRFVGAGSAITGRGAHWFFVDDPIKNDKIADSELSSEDLWTWYWTAARTRLAPKGAMVVMHTRWRVNDLIGRLLEQKRSSWNVLNFPAIAKVDEYHPRTGHLLRRAGEALHPGRYDLEDLEDMKSGMPGRSWLALYQQDPVAEEGNIFKRAFFKMYKPTEMPDIKNMHVYIPGDFATSEKTTADYTAMWPYAVDKDGVIWWLPDLFHDKVDTGAAALAFVDNVKRHGALAGIIEAGGIYNSIAPLIQLAMKKQNCHFTIFNPPAVVSKTARASTAAGFMELGMMRFPDTREFETVIQPEMLAFPFGKNDDIVDNVSLAAQAMEEKYLLLPTGLDLDDATFEESPDLVFSFTDKPPHGWKGVDDDEEDLDSSGPFEDGAW